MYSDGSDSLDKIINNTAFQSPIDLIKKIESSSISTTVNNMAPSASKQKRLAEKAAKKNAGGGLNGSESPSTSTPTGSVNGASTPLTSMSGVASKAGSSEDLMSMARLNIATDRYVLFIELGSPWPFSKWILGVLLVFWFLMSKVEISKLIPTLCLSMEDYLSRVLRLHLTMDSDMVYLERTVLER